MPNGLGVLIGLQGGQRNHFDAGELKRAIQSKDDWVGAAFGRVTAAGAETVRTRTMDNLNTLASKPVSIEVHREGNKRDNHREERPLFFAHNQWLTREPGKLFECANKMHAGGTVCAKFRTHL